MTKEELKKLLMSTKNVSDNFWDELFLMYPELKHADVKDICVKNRKKYTLVCLRKTDIYWKIKWSLRKRAGKRF